jgi:hypothetical protein
VVVTPAGLSARGSGAARLSAASRLRAATTWLGQRRGALAAPRRRPPRPHRLATAPRPRAAQTPHAACAAGSAPLRSALPPARARARALAQEPALVPLQSARRRLRRWARRDSAQRSANQYARPRPRPRRVRRLRFPPSATSLWAGWDAASAARRHASPTLALFRTGWIRAVRRYSRRAAPTHAAPCAARQYSCRALRRPPLQLTMGWGVSHSQRSLDGPARRGGPSGQRRESVRSARRSIEPHAVASSLRRPRCRRHSPAQAPARVAVPCAPV